MVVLPAISFAAIKVTAEYFPKKDRAYATSIFNAGASIGALMMELAGLSFLGFGSQPPAPEWGLMLNEGRQQLQTAPWLMFFPGLAIFVTVVVFNLWGDNLRDVLDPRGDVED